MKRALSILLLLALFLSACCVSTAEEEGAEGTVAIYSSMYPFVLEMLDQAIHEKFPGLIPGGENGSFFIYDGSTALIKRIEDGMKTGVLECDMMLVAEPSLSIEMKEKNYLAPVEIPGITDLLRFPCDEEGYWYPVRVCNMVLAYNPELEADWNGKGITIPRTFQQFAADRSLKGLISMGDPMTSGTTFASVAALTSRYGRQFLKGLGQNMVRIEKASSAMERIQEGSCAVAMILEETVLKTLKDAEDAGQPLTNLACIYPEDGAVLIPSTVMIVADAHSANHNTASCAAVEKWFLTGEAQAIIMEGFMHSVLREQKEGPWHSAETDSLAERMMSVDWDNTYRYRSELNNAWLDIVYFNSSVSSR